MADPRFPNGSKPCSVCGTKIPALQPHPKCNACVAQSQQQLKDLADAMGNTNMGGDKKGGK